MSTAPEKRLRTRLRRCDLRDGGFECAECDDLAAVLDDNARMREALTEIADQNNWGHDGGWDARSHPDKIAHEALAPRTTKAAKKGKRT